MDTIPQGLPVGRTVTDLYQAAIGDKNQDYYIAKFEDFDQHGPGLQVSWNWAAFFFTGFWALYRRMYGWFVVWWVMATIIVVFEKVPNVQIHQLLAVVVGVLWLGFGALANALYHRNVRARIAAVQKASTDGAWVTRRLHASSGVLAWVPFVFGGIPVIGIVAALALPAYQDYAKRAGNGPTVLISQPTKTPAPKLDLSEFEKQDLKAQGIGGNQDLADVAAWADSQMAARFLNASELLMARNFALMWQRQLIVRLRIPPERALFLGASVVISMYDGKIEICRPDMSRDGGIEDIGDHHFKALPECVAR